MKAESVYLWKRKGYDTNRANTCMSFTSASFMHASGAVLPLAVKEECGRGEDESRSELGHAMQESVYLFTFIPLGIHTLGLSV